MAKNMTYTTKLQYTVIYWGHVSQILILLLAKFVYIDKDISSRETYGMNFNGLQWDIYSETTHIRWLYASQLRLPCPNYPNGNFIT